MKLTKEEVVKRIKDIHGEKYGKADEIEYNGINQKVELTCSIHGVFLITPKSLFKGCGCRMCANKKNASLNKLDTKTFIERANKVHNNKYIYNKADYKGSEIKICITCPIHGNFWQRPSKHLSGQGCSKCYNERIMSFEDFQKEASKIHNNKYHYHNETYKDKKTKTCITCPIHGDFWQRPYAHVDKKQGCPKCGIEFLKSNNTKTQEQFEKELFEIHKDNIVIGKVPYKNSHTKIELICKRHGSFYATPNNILKYQGCPKCRCVYSKEELEVKDFIEKLIDNKVEKYTLKDKRELDILIPNKNIAFEFDGLYWHSEIKKDKNYHLSKTIQSEREGIKLFHIFEDEWINKREIVKSKITHILGETKNKLFARKCIIKEVSQDVSDKFLKENHINGTEQSEYSFGLYYNNELVYLITFNRLANNNNIEIIRLCCKKYTSIIGGVSKLLHYIIKRYMPSKIVSSVDVRWYSGKLYEKIGFINTYSNKPNYSYIVSHHREDKTMYDNNKNSHQNMKEKGIYRIYDCGSKTYEMKLNYV